MPNGAPKPIRVGFLQLPRYSMIAFASAVEPLRMANHLSGQTLYQWSALTFDGKPVAASNGVSFATDTGIHHAEHLDMLFVCGGIDVRLSFDKPMIDWLRRLAHQHVILGGLCTGSYLLARAGLLDGYRATIHWENIAGLREEFPRIDSTDELFVMDRDRYTCSGGIAPLDMMLTLISQQQGIELAAGISEEFIHERIRTIHDHQRDPLRLRIGLGQPKLIEAVSLMEANVEEPLALDELARYVHVSRRQLERLFKQYLNCAPTRYYLKLRLTRARQFLLQTTMPIADVTLACGFVSAPHFSKCYRDLFGVPPSHERRPRGHVTASGEARGAAGRP
ncbi:MAG: GlxA family transcriptional regulator [Gammaproteobacteria bacterium]